MTHRRRRWLTPLLALLVVIAGMATQPLRAAASPLTTTQNITPQPLNCTAAVTVVLVVVEVVPDASGSRRTSADNRVGQNGPSLRFFATGVTVYVNGDPVNLSDPSGHRFTTGDDRADAQSTCFGCNPLDRSEFWLAKMYFRWREASDAASEARAGAGAQREIAAEQLAFTNDVLNAGAAQLNADIQYEHMQAAAASAEQRKTCDSFWCGVTQAVYGTVSGLGTVLGGPAASRGVQQLNHWIGADQNPWLAGTCTGWCIGGKATVEVASLFAGGVGILTKAVKAARLLGAAAEGGVSLEASAAARATELQGMLPAGSAGRVTMGFGYARDAEGGLVRLVGTSEPGGYLRPGVTLNDGEIMASGMGHAEQDIIAYAQANNWEMVTVAAGRPICPMCVDEILGSGATMASAAR